MSRKTTFATHASRLFAAAVIMGGMAAAPAQAAKKQFVFVHDRNSVNNRVFSYSLANNGQLKLVGGSPFPTSAGTGSAGGHCQTGAYSARRKLLFVSGGSGIVALRVASNGSMAEVAGSPFGPAANYLGVSVVEKGSSTFVYTSEFDNDWVRGFKVEGDATLTELANSPYPCGDAPDGISAASDLVFVANENDQTISSYRVAANGDLVEAPGSPIESGLTSLYNVHVDLTASSVYVASDSSSLLYGFKVDKTSGALTPLPDSPFQSDVLGVGPGLAVSQKVLILPGLGKAVDQLQTYRRASNGSVTRQGGAQNNGLSETSALALNKAGKLLAVTGFGVVRTYRILKSGESVQADEQTDPINNPNQILIVTR